MLPHLWQNERPVSGTREAPSNPDRVASPRDIGPASPRGFRRLTHVVIRSEKTVAVKIRLLRMGKIRNPQYRIVVADARTKRDGRALEFVGIYHPKEDPSLIEVNSERVQHWLKDGDQPSEAVRANLSKPGDWQMFKALPAP